MCRSRVAVSVKGLVQSVGFRPFVVLLARQHGLSGWIRNTSGAVEIEVEGDADSVSALVLGLTAQAPPRARVESVDVRQIPLQIDSGFEIRDSLRQEGQSQLVAPDIATCDACLAEGSDPDNRRFGYPFTNCTHCGPRFTIIADVPYDRPETTMRAFAMCPECRQEYRDVADRRFHAQPIACRRCGPTCWLVDANGVALKAVDPIAEAAALVRQGKIVAIKGVGGFLLTCDATNEATVQELRRRKHRGAKPFAVMVRSPEEAARYCAVSPAEREQLLSPEAPIVLLRWHGSSASSLGSGRVEVAPAVAHELAPELAPEVAPAVAPAVAAGVAPGLGWLGVMVPYSPLHHFFVEQCGVPVVMTSGNLSEEPIAKDNDEALARLGGIAHAFLMHNRDILMRVDDSVVIVEGVARPMRRARGYAPQPISLAFESTPILAVGSKEKNTFCLSKGIHAFLSPHMGDLDNRETLIHFERTLGHYRRLFRLKPQVIACDMHPDYLSTAYAQRLHLETGMPLLAVQHHHAHIASCLAEHGENGPVIGVAFDGTGYGVDGTIWGGEFFVGGLAGFTRVGHLPCVALPGGEAAIRRPWRMAVSYLLSLLGDETSFEGLPLERISPLERSVVAAQVGGRLPSPRTSSAGRLFDGVAALVGIRGEVEYEAQAAMELEMAATIALENLADRCQLCDERLAPWPTPFAKGPLRIPLLQGLLAGIISDVLGGVPTGLTALRFHRTMARLIVDVCCDVRTSHVAGPAIGGPDGGPCLNTVALSGGVFQNRLLLRLAVEGLEQAGFRVLTHRLVPCNDGGLALGQASMAHWSRGS